MSAARILWSARARRDLIEIRRFIAQDNPTAADRWIERLRRRAREAADFPNSGRIVPELGRNDVREVFVRNYRIVYRLGEDEIVVLTVFEGHRRLSEEAGSRGAAEGEE